MYAHAISFSVLTSSVGVGCVAYHASASRPYAIALRGWSFFRRSVRAVRACARSAPDSDGSFASRASGVDCAPTGDACRAASSASVTRAAGRLIDRYCRRGFLLLSHRTRAILLLHSHMTAKSDVWQGTLALMVLKTLDTLGPLHGYGIARRIEQTSAHHLSVNYGTLYPALLKLEQEGYIASDWGVSDNNRRAKYYRLTRAGRKQL